MKEAAVTVKYKDGLHARPAVKFIKLITPMASRVTIHKGEDKYDAKNIFSVLAACITSGQTVRISAEGEDEDKAIAAITEYFEGS